MRQMRLKGRPHVHQELLELGVRSVGDQDLIQRVDDGLVIRHLTVDIGLVERLALERLDRRASLGRSLEERLTDRVVLRCDTELGGKRGGLRVDRYACPLSAVTAQHPEVCALARALVEEITGRPVTECCDRNGRPRCGFRIDDEPESQRASFHA